MLNSKAKYRIVLFLLILMQLQLENMATNDNEIIAHTDAFTEELTRYKTLATDVEAIQERVIRVLSAKYS